MPAIARAYSLVNNPIVHIGHNFYEGSLFAGAWDSSLIKTRSYYEYQLLRVNNHAQLGFLIGLMGIRICGNFCKANRLSSFKE